MPDRGSATSNRIAHPWATVGASVLDMDIREKGKRNGHITAVGATVASVLWNTGKTTTIKLERLRPPHYLLRWDRALPEDSDA